MREKFISLGNLTRTRGNGARAQLAACSTLCRLQTQANRQFVIKILIICQFIRMQDAVGIATVARLCDHRLENITDDVTRDAHRATL